MTLVALAWIYIALSKVRAIDGDGPEAACSYPGWKSPRCQRQRGLFYVNRVRIEGCCHLFTEMASLIFRASRTLNSVSIRGLPSSESAR